MRRHMRDEPIGQDQRAAGIVQYPWGGHTIPPISDTPPSRSSSTTAARSPDTESAEHRAATACSLGTLREVAPYSERLHNGNQVPYLHMSRSDKVRASASASRCNGGG